MQLTTDHMGCPDTLDHLSRARHLRLRLGVELATLQTKGILAGPFTGIPTSITNMNPSNRFIQALASMPIAEGVITHSIIAVQGDGPPENCADGIVMYRSAHIEGVASEKVVRSGQSVQRNPETIQEVKRILMEHAEQAAVAAAN